MLREFALRGDGFAYPVTLDTYADVKHPMGFDPHG